MKPWIHAAHVPIYLLMLTAVTASVMGLAQYWPRSRRLCVDFGISASPFGLLMGTVALVAYLFLFAALVTAGLIVGAGFGVFYLLLGAALIMFVLIPAMGIPRLSRRIEALTARQIVLGAAVVTMAAFVSSFAYFIVANGMGIAIRFGSS